MITIANPEKYIAGLYERLSNENIEVASGEVVVSNEDELESRSISTVVTPIRTYTMEQRKNAPKDSNEYFEV